MGLWYHQRQFLLPLFVFLLAMICIDIMWVLQYYHFVAFLEPLGNKISFYPMKDSTVPILALKLLFSVCLGKGLFTNYRRDLIIRTLRNKTQLENLDKIEKESCVEGSNVPETELGKYSRFTNCPRE